MKELLDLTQLLYSCWIVSGSSTTGKETIPTGGSVLEYALQDVVQRGIFPQWAREQLHFVSGDAGLTCLELPSIERLATELKYTSDPNPSYTKTSITVGKPMALRCLARLRIPEGQAREWGTALRVAVEKAAEQMQLEQAV